MLNNIIEFSVKNKLIIGLFVLTLIGYGSYEVTRLPIDAVPDITNNQVQIITVAPSFGATDIERLVTFPIEQATANIPGTIEIRSFSRFGLSLVTIVFSDETDLYLARQQVSERLLKVQNIIPKEFGVPELGPVTTGLGEIYQYVIKAKPGYEHRYALTELRSIQDWLVRRELLSVDGVAEVSSFGGKLKQYEIAVNYHKLQSYHISMQDIFTALENNNQNTGGAYIEKGPTLLFVRSEGLIGTISDIENISIKNLDNGTPLFIRDVAEVRLGYAARYGAMCYNNTGEVTGAVVMMLKGANSSKVIRNVKERVELIRKILPEGVTIEPFLDRSKMVKNAISTVSYNLMEGALIVVFILVLFLGNFRAGLLVASIIPLSMLFAVILMNFFGVSGNLMSLGALDFGLIVDGAVIIVEATLHQLTHSRKFKPLSILNQQTLDKEVTTSAGKMMNSAVFGQIIILIVYLPIFTLQGIEGKMFKPMAQTVAFALTGAFILSLTYIPMMSALVLNKKIPAGESLADTYFSRLRNIYSKYLKRVLLFPKTVVSVAIGLFLVSLVVLSRMGGEFIPALEEGDFAVDARVLTGSNLNTSIAHVTKASEILLNRFPEVEKVVTKIGSGEVPTDPMPIEASDMMVILKDKKEWTSATSFNELAEQMGNALQAIPGLTVGFQYPVQMRFNELMTGARQDVVCKIFGENLDSLTHYANQLGKIIHTVEGAEDLYIESTLGMPQALIKFNRSAIAQYRLSIADINRTINTAFAGQVAGLVMEGEKRFNLSVRLAAEQRRDIENVRNLLIPTPDGNEIPLYLLADITLINGPNQIQREDAKRRIVVGFNIRNRDVQSIVKELQMKADKNLHFSSGYYIKYGGTFENLNAAKRRLMIAVPVSLLLILLLLYFAFDSVKQALLIYSAIPLSAIGGIFFLALRGMPFSISAGIGFIALFGVSVLNGIVLVAEFRRLKQEGLLSIYEIVIKGTGIRLRPVLMTAAVASLGFLPMALSHGAGAEVQRPLATVVIGGLLFATFLTLFVLPTLYILFNKMKPINNKIAIMICLSGCLFSTGLSAQTPISLQQAIDTAVYNNLYLKNEVLKIQYRKKLLKSENGLPKTVVMGEYGQINSAYNDNKINITQSMAFPTVYTNHNRLRNAEIKNANALVAMKQSELIKQVKLTYYYFLYLQNKKQLLLRIDSNYAQFLQTSRYRHKAGESNILELKMAETQKESIYMQLMEVNQDIEIITQKFQMLLQTNDNLMPKNEPLLLPVGHVTDSMDLSSHPYIKSLAYRLSAAEAQKRWIRSKSYPDISFGYSNMTIKGFGADGLQYGSSSRFQAAQVSIGIPLFFGASKARVNAAALETKMEEINYQIGIREMQTEYRKTGLEYTLYKNRVAYYETTALKNAELIFATADFQFNKGEINYLQWVAVTNQSITIQSNYLDAVKQLNEIIIQLQYLNSQTP